MNRRRMLKTLGRVYVFILITPLTLLFTVTSLYSLSHPKAKFQVLASTTNPQAIYVGGEVLGTQVVDFRPIRVAKFLKNTPLGDYSDAIIASSDKYGIDYRLIPAIAMKESGGGRAAPEGSYNAWGFANGKTRFTSWEQAIDIVAKTLKENYVAKGMTSPDDMMPVYAPPAVENGGGWAKAINGYLAQMENTQNSL